MEYFMIAPLNILVIASEKKFVDSAFEKYEFLRNFAPEYADLPELEYGHRVLADKDFRIFDASKPWPNGRPIHGDFDKISSEDGVMWKVQAPILEDWKGPQKTTAATNTTKPTTTTTGGNSVKTTKKTETKVTATASKGDDDAALLVDAKVVEVEINTGEEAKKAMDHVAALGVIVTYDTPKAIAESIGVKEDDLNEMSGVVLANKLAELHFGIGHAASMLRAKNDIADIRRKAASKDSKMEKMAEKQKKAEDHIWEYRQLVTLVCALHKGGYKMTKLNVGVALAAFPNLEESRKKEILRAAEQLMEDESAQKLIDQLVDGFRSAGRAKKAKAAEAS